MMTRFGAGLALVALLSTSACVGVTASPEEAADGPTETSQSDFRIYLYPDLTVWGQESSGGWGGFTVANQGVVASAPFRIAVLAGSESYSVSSPGLAAGATEWYGTQFFCACGQSVGVIVDVDNTVAESNENNNATTFDCPCLNY